MIVELAAVQTERLIREIEALSQETMEPMPFSDAMAT